MGSEEQKRKEAPAADGEEAAAKRQRVENGSSAGAAAGSGAPAAGATVPRRLGIDLEKLQQAKLALQKQKELAERLKKAGITVGVSGGALCGRLAGCAAHYSDALKPCASSVLQLGKPGAAAAAPRPPAPNVAAAAAAVAAAMLPPGAAPTLAGLSAADMTAAALGVSLPKPATKLPPPLLLDDQGRQVDATGKVVERAPAPVLQAPGAQLQQEQQKEEDAEK